MLSLSESRVYPYQRVEETWKCNFCDSKNATVQRFRFDVETPEQSCRELFVCSESECNNVFDASVQFFNKNEGRVPLQQILRTVPKFAELSFTVRRSNGELDEGWRIPPSGVQGTSYEFNTLQKLRGEPWWRVVLAKDTSIRHTFLHELRELNADSLGEDWDLIFSLLPNAGEPSETFLQFYTPETWTLKNPSDKELHDLRFKD